MIAIVQECRHAARRLRRSPSFTVASILTLALAIGANAAIFTLVYRVVLNPLPYGESDRLVSVDIGMPGQNIARGINSITLPMYFQYLDRARTIDQIALHQSDEATLTGPGTPERLRIARTTASLVPLLRVGLQHGRWFAPDDERPGAPAVTVLSYGLWQRRFGGDPAIVGRTVTLNGVPTTVLGVTRASFAYPDARVDLYTPVSLSRSNAIDSYSFTAVARMRDAATIEDTRAELTRLTRELHDSRPGNGYDMVVSTATTLIEMTVGRVARMLWILLASVGLVMLVACANVANLFLVRSEARQREIAVRRALGATGGAVSRYFLAESLLLAACGGVLGLGLAWIGIRLLTTYGPANLPRLDEVQLGGVAAIFTLVLSLMVALVFGSIPLARLLAVPAALPETGRGNTASRRTHRTRHALIGAQVALALVLLVSSGLMLRSYQMMRAFDPGFVPDSALTFRVGLPRAEYPERSRMIAAYDAIAERLREVPGVTDVSAVTCLPLSGRGFCSGSPAFVEGRVLAPGTIPPIVAVRAAAAGYLDAAGIRLVRGRRLEHADQDRGEAVAVVNQAFVTAYFPSGEPLGQRVRFVGQRSPWMRIVGIVSNTPTVTFTEAPVAKAYLPLLSNDDGRFGPPATPLGPSIDAMSYVVRTSVVPESVLAGVRRAIAEVDPNLALAQVRTLQDYLDTAAAHTAFTMVLLLIAAGAALLLGVIGIYGVMSYIVSQRTSEIGVRLALGATPASLAAMMSRQGGLAAVVGVLAGLAAALAGTRVIETLLFGVTPRDPGVFVVTTATIALVATVSCWLPARRAARLSPLDALRAE